MIDFSLVSDPLAITSPAQRRAYDQARLFLLKGVFPTPTKMNVALHGRRSRNLNGRDCKGRERALLEFGYERRTEGQRIRWRKKPVFVLEHTRVTVTNVHDPALCAGRPCTIHNRSDHHMRSWPQNFRPDRGIMERICEHGVGHPDPDDLDWRPETSDGRVEGRDTAGIHGCDGCCAP